MAGETPGASNAGKKRKRLNFGDDKSTGKYYASANPSAITNSIGDSRGRIGSKPQPIPTPNPKLDERSADKKYYASPTAPKGKPPERRQLGAPVEQTPAIQERLASLTITRDSEVNQVMDEAVRRLHDSNEKVVVTVADGSPLRRAMTKRDSLVTRQLITEDQARDIVFSKLPVKERPSKAERQAAAAEQTIESLLASPPVPSGTTSLDDEEPLDIDAILSGAAPIEKTVDTTPQNVTEVDLSAQAEDEDEGDDVGPVSEPETTPAEPEPQPTSTSQDVCEEASPDGSNPETVTPPAPAPAEGTDAVDGDDEGDE